VTHVIALAGPTGAGKTTAAHILAEMIYAEHYDRPTVYEMSDFVRDLYAEEHEGVADGDILRNVDDNALGRWASEQTDEHGPDYFARRLVEDRLLDDDKEFAIVSGLRRPEGLSVMRDVLVPDANALSVIALDVPQTMRFERKARSGTSEDEFARRTEREMVEWGCQHFFEPEKGLSDYIVDNSRGTEALRGSMSEIVADLDGLGDLSAVRTVDVV